MCSWNKTLTKHESKDLRGEKSCGIVCENFSCSFFRISFILRHKISTEWQRVLTECKFQFQVSVSLHFRMSHKIYDKVSKCCMLLKDYVIERNYYFFRGLRNFDKMPFVFYILWVIINKAIFLQQNKHVSESEYWHMNNIHDYGSLIYCRLWI